MVISSIYHVVYTVQIFNIICVYWLFRTTALLTREMIIAFEDDRVYIKSENVILIESIP